MSRGGRMEPSHQRQNQGQCLNSRCAAAFLSVHDEFPGSLQENLLIAMHRSVKLLSIYYTLWVDHLCQRVFRCWSRWQRLEFVCHPVICTPGCWSLLPPLLLVAYESTRRGSGNKTRGTEQKQTIRQGRAVVCCIDTGF